MADGTVKVRQDVDGDRLMDAEVLTVAAQTVHRQRVRDPDAVAMLTQVRDAIMGTLTAVIAGQVALDGPTLAALESVNAAVTGVVALDAATLTALEQITATVANLPADYPLPAAQVTALTPPTNGLTNTQLRATPVPVSGFPADQKVHDDYQSGEVLEDQTGAGGVLLFTFSAPVQLVVVDANGAVTDVARADPFGGTPTATRGVACRDETPAYMPVATSAVRVFTPVGMAVSVAGYRRT